MQCIAMYTTSATSARWGLERLGIFGTSREARRFIRNLEPIYREGRRDQKILYCMGEAWCLYPALYMEFSHGYRSERGPSASAGVPLREGRGRLTHLHDAPIEGEY